MPSLASVMHQTLTALGRSVSAALFGLLLLLAFALTAPMGKTPWLGLYRYDYLLIFALAVQALLLYWRLEHWPEARVIALFHVLAMGMELFLTHPAIGSWQYPQPAIFRLYTVPLFAGFMYSAVGSFFARSLRLFSIEFERLPPLGWLMALAVVSYVNFMSKFFIPDLRYVLFVLSIALFWRTRMTFDLGSGRLGVPMLPVLLLLAFLIWIAENISTFYQIWLYPSQVERWHMVGWAKMGSWYLLLLLSLVLVLQIMGRWTPQAGSRLGHWQLRRDA